MIPGVVLGALIFLAVSLVLVYLLAHRPRQAEPERGFEPPPPPNR